MNEEIKEILESIDKENKSIEALNALKDSFETEAKIDGTPHDKEIDDIKTKIRDRERATCKLYVEAIKMQRDEFKELTNEYESAGTLKQMFMSRKAFTGFPRAYRQMRIWNVEEDVVAAWNDYYTWKLRAYNEKMKVRKVHSCPHCGMMAASYVDGYEICDWCSHDRNIDKGY